jgi:hypothetical protein
MTQMQKAILALINAINAGAELPDVSWKIADQYGVSCSKLEALYDDTCADSNQR